MNEWQPLRLVIQSALLALGSIAGVVLLCWLDPRLVPLKYPVLAATLLALLGAVLAIRKPTPMMGARRREASVMLVAHATMLLSGLIFLCSLGLQSVSPGWMWTLIWLCLLISLHALAVSLLARGVLMSRVAYYADHCPTCLYDLTAIESPTCPECGTPITPPRTAATPAPDR